MDLEPSRSEDEASFDRPLDMSTGVGAGERPRQRSGAPWLWLLVVLAAAVAGLLYWRSRGPAAPAPAVRSRRRRPRRQRPSCPRLRPLPLVAASATAAPAATRPLAVSPTSRRPQPTAAPAAAPQGRQKWLDRAARDGRRADADRRARFTIQLELVCQEESLSDAWKYDRPSGTMWLLTTPFQARRASACSGAVIPRARRRSARLPGRRPSLRRRATGPWSCPYADRPLSAIVSDHSHGDPMTTPTASAGFRGSLAETPLPQVLRRIFLEGLKGTLSLVHGDETRHLFFEKGELRTATSSREGQRIGAFLKRRGCITDTDLNWALETVAKQGRARLGKILVDRGLVSRTVLDAEMRRLVEEIVFSTFAWEIGGVQVSRLRRRARPGRRAVDLDGRDHRRGHPASAGERASSASGSATATGFRFWRPTRCRATSTCR